ncbi:MAG TPA: hypothetical protein VEA80_00260 [Vitreimonas sp.]|uniref:hypothetical protein n=1 Tax=Vitreimonas sp. TaxID=3069702 RepID=UPI002D2EEA18|nr:hypothetical protein [Vitreimonas sp.]HYD85886.1 hypothetical protein [Vitreimonas sp.]
MNALAPPDLETAEGRSAYRRELRAVARWPRLIGFAIIIVSAVAVLSLRSDPNAGAALYAGYAGLVIGWIALIYAFVQRNIYHRRRLRQIGNDHARG